MATRIRVSLLAAVSALVLCGVLAATASAAPTASTPPTISGTGVYGSTLTCTNGTWSAGAGSFVYTWQLADGHVTIGHGATLRVKGPWVSYGIVCAVSGTDTTGTATATSAPITAAAAATPVTITLAREVSTATRKIMISGHIAPTASLKGGSGSLILYRETSAGLQQLSFNGSQTRPNRNGTFTMTSVGEPAGRHTYVVEYVPSALGYAAQTTVTRVLRVTG